jgi:ribonuclease P protein subunit POP4
MIDPYNILRHELVGLGVKAKTKDAELVGVVDEETEKTIKIKTPSGVKSVVKDSAVLELELPSDAVVEVAGKLLAGRPQDRIKKKHRIRY